MGPMAHKMMPRYKWNKQLTTFMMDMMGKESVSQIEMEYTFDINRSKSNECSGAGEYEHGTYK